MKAFITYLQLAYIVGMTAMLVASCAETHTIVTGYSKSGQPIGEFHTIVRVYGKQNAESLPFGVTAMTNLDIGFKAFVNAVVALAGAMYYGNLQMEKETTQQLANAGMTQVQLRKLDTALAESLASKGFEGTLQGIKAGLFTPAGTVFKQTP